ncbi:MAG TPA: hypothetical protein PKV06_11100 [bacterium]|nr:hypothetical protein [bacterium]HNH30973.1 hypothetical protein [bacterium]HNH34238.1 hypothetical protein [bacterium]
MYRNALYEIGNLLQATDGISRVYIQQRDFNDQFDITNTIGGLQKPTDVLAVVKTTGVNDLYKPQDFIALGFKMGFTIELFAGVDKVSDYSKSSESSFDRACFNVLKKFMDVYHINIIHPDDSEGTLTIESISGVTPRDMTVIEELNKSAHHITFTLEAWETLT